MAKLNLLETDARHVPGNLPLAGSQAAREAFEEQLKHWRPTQEQLERLERRRHPRSSFRPPPENGNGNGS